MTIDFLTGLFAGATLMAAAAVGLYLVRQLPAKLDARIEAGVAERLLLMRGLADGWQRADADQRERLARNYRFLQAEVLKLRPHLAASDISIVAGEGVYRDAA